jgi:centromere protein K
MHVSFFFFFNVSSCSKVKKTIKDMSENKQEVHPDTITDVEAVIDTEEELIKECEEMWKDMEDVSFNR